MRKMKGSRRAASLRSSDYDHEIALVDDEDRLAESPSSGEEPALTASNTSTRRLTVDTGFCDGDNNREEDEEQPRDDELQQHAVSSKGMAKLGSGHIAGEQSSTRPPRPSAETQGPTVVEQPQDGPAYHIVSRRPRRKRETAIDILYENERGGFLCGIALFSSAALGGLDPTPWTNGYHKASPTSIYTAQCPDPSWEWVWPEWRIYQKEGTEEDGWEYSFHFSKSFSWHKPKWYNSFVRRRAWIRRRAKRRPQDIPADYHMYNSDYFSVHAASERDPRSGGSVTSSHPSRSSWMRTSMAEVEEEMPIIEDIDMLMHVLRLARIDREKREAVENYLEHAIDLAALQHEMEEIMSLFVFQTSRRQLLALLMHEHDETAKEEAKEESLGLRLHREALDAAIKRAEEEILKHAYWSDVKAMAESGELLTPGDGKDAWQGLDKSDPGPPPSNGKMPQR